MPSFAFLILAFRESKKTAVWCKKFHVCEILTFYRADRIKRLKTHAVFYAGFSIHSFENSIFGRYFWQIGQFMCVFFLSRVCTGFPIN